MVSQANRANVSRTASITPVRDAPLLPPTFDVGAMGEWGNDAGTQLNGLIVRLDGIQPGARIQIRNARNKWVTVAGDTTSPIVRKQVLVAISSERANALGLVSDGTVTLRQLKGRTASGELVVTLPETARNEDRFAVLADRTQVVTIGPQMAVGAGIGYALHRATGGVRRPDDTFEPTPTTQPIDPWNLPADHAMKSIIARTPVTLSGDLEATGVTQLRNVGGAPANGQLSLPDRILNDGTITIQVGNKKASATLKKHMTFEQASEALRQAVRRAIPNADLQINRSVQQVYVIEPNPNYMSPAQVQAAADRRRADIETWRQQTWKPPIRNYDLKVVEESLSLRSQIPGALVSYESRPNQPVVRHVNPEFKLHHEQNLMNFLQYGDNSLTLDEVTRLAAAISKQWTMADYGAFRAGDRVHIHTNGLRGVVVGSYGQKAEILTVVDGDFHVVTVPRAHLDVIAAAPR